jgi:3-hydroxyisobutyrate dehydrogenase-like beta-hydroxyacid dehydrogenase
MTTAIGFIGLGTMGTPMVRRLLTDGHSVTVWSRRREAIAALTPAGARRIASALSAQGVEMLDAPVSAMFSVLNDPV